MKRIVVSAFVILSLVVLSAATVLAAEGRPEWGVMTVPSSSQSL